MPLTAFSSAPPIQPLGATDPDIAGRLSCSLQRYEGRLLEDMEPSKWKLAVCHRSRVLRLVGKVLTNLLVEAEKCNLWSARLL